ncbi:hypothetical protein QT974_06185, partial [Microcoleus sp. herbarium12]
DVTDVRKKGSATDFVTDVTDVTDVRKKGSATDFVTDVRKRKKEEFKAFESPQFLLVKQRRDAPEIVAGILDKTLSQLERPLDLWLVNFRAPVNLAAQKCQLESRDLPAVDGYEYQVYHCY